MTTPFPLELAPGVPLEMILVPPGYFIMGSEAEEAFASERPEHIVHITQPFYMGKYPITQAQWQAVMGDDHQAGFPGPDRPVENVSWIDIVTRNQEENGQPSFLHKINEILSAKRPALYSTHRFELPTEAQWEYAAKGGPRYQLEELRGKQANDLYTAYAGSDRLESCGWFDGNNDVETRAVGLKAPNELGLYDLTGNVWEWCRDNRVGDIYKKRKDSITADPVELNHGGNRVLRGGSSWGNAGYCRAARRYSYHPANRHGGLGFRVVLSPSSGSGEAG